MSDLIETYHPIFDSLAWWDICANRKPVQLTPDQELAAANLPDFDDPLFDFKLHYTAVPLEERKRLFVCLWETFDYRTRLDLAARVSGRVAA